MSQKSFAVLTLTGGEGKGKPSDRLDIFVDGVRVSGLERNESKSLLIEAGADEVHIALGSRKSPRIPLHVVHGETVQLACGDAIDPRPRLLGRFFGRNSTLYCTPIDPEEPEPPSVRH